MWCTGQSILTKMSVLTTFHEGKDDFIFFTKESEENVDPFTEEEKLNCSETMVEDQGKKEILKYQTQDKIPRKRPEFKCQECSRNFTSKQSLKIHKTGVHRKTVEFCTFCGKTVSLSNLKRHIKEKHQKEKKPCPECGKEYGMSNLSHHIRAIHKKESRQCPICGMVCSSGNFSIHIKAFHGDLKKVCDVCNEEILYGQYSEHRSKRHNMTGKMASVIDDPSSIIIKREIVEGEDTRVKSLNVGDKMFTFTLV